MATINLREFYPWYTHDEFTEVSDEIAEELFADKRYGKANKRRVQRNKAQYTLDADDGIESASFACSLNNPEDIVIMMEQRCELCNTLRTLPRKQGERVRARFIFGISQKEIAKADGVSEAAVSKAIDKGLAAMKNYLSFSGQEG